ncbi:MAG: cobalamin biosynthesis protein [Gammaproteobacteria bacterium]|nr:cobalamin biosynthesis protein [Gammaproteobacteria bacterium]
MLTALVLFAALALDAWLGEARRFHPLVGFGTLAQKVEQRWYADSRTRGAIAVLLLLIPFTLLALMTQWLPGSIAIDVLLLYVALGWNSLKAHAGAVCAALLAHDLPEARQRVGFLVSRDTATLDQTGVANATVESVLENGNDAIFGAIFWFVVAGAAGVVLYRLANTLDAMWGYRNERYLQFGWAAARLDDVMNLIPARLTALGYAVAGRFMPALRCWHHQGRHWKSPNAGPVMAAGAGSIGVLIGGPAMYHGEQQQRRSLGEGHAPDPNTIDQALRLIRRTLFLWLLVIFTGGWIVSNIATH